MKKTITIEEFKRLIATIDSARSVRDGIVYDFFYDDLDFGRINGRRESTNSVFEIDVKELYNAFTDLDCACLTTSALRFYISGRVQSPSCALLRELNSRY